MRGAIFTIETYSTLVDSHNMYKGDLIGLKLQGMAEPNSSEPGVNECTQKFFQGSGIKQYVTQK